MKWKPYPTYKPSGVEWLGDVPAHWCVDRLKWSTHGAVNGIWGEEPDGVNDIYCIRVADFDRQALRVSGEALTIRSVPLDQRRRRQLRRGDLLIEKSGGGDNQLVGCVVHFDLDCDAVCSNFVARMPTTDGNDPKFWTFVHAALYRGRLNYPAVKQTTGIQNLDGDAYLDTMVAWPDLAEQRSIAACLGRESMNVDALVAKKRALVERLREKRTALISRTVTRGLPPEAARAAGLAPHPKLKPSGVPWLGDIPEHWRVKRLKHVVSSMEQGWSPDCSSHPAGIDEWGVVKAGCCNGGLFNAEENKALPADLEPLVALELKPGDLLMSRASGSEELLGSVALVPAGTRPKLLLSDKIYRLRSLPRVITARFLTWVLQSEIGRFQVRRIVSGASGLAKNIAQGDVREFVVLLPPLPEQQAIAEYLDRETARIDRLVEKVEAAIERLQEYRQALITAAVTGKIDVRELPTPRRTSGPDRAGRRGMVRHGHSAGPRDASSAGPVVGLDGRRVGRLT